MKPTLPELPAWPVGLLLCGYPVWWALGLAPLAVATSALVMTALLTVRGRVVVVPAAALWAAFLLVVVASAVELDSTLRVVGYLVRFLDYAGAGVVLLYVVNARSRVTVRTVTTSAAVLFACAVVGGWLGVLFPHGAIPTVVAHLTPTSLADNDFVQTIVHPPFAQVQQDYGQVQAIARPSAPFAYTNSWGCTVAILVPFLVLDFLQTSSRRRRVALVALLAAAAVPAAATLDRGMALAIGIGLLWASVRYAMRRRLAAAGVLVAACIAAVVLVATTGVLTSLTERLRLSHTNAGRLALYREAWDGARRSPLLGHGAPRPSATTDVSVGTQGVVWTVMYSFGLVALVCFLAFLLWAVVRAGRLPGPPGVWLQVALLSVLVCSVVYDFEGPELSLLMVAAGLAFRPLGAAGPSGPPGPGTPGAEPGPPPPPQGRTQVLLPVGDQLVDQAAG